MSGQPTYRTCALVLRKVKLKETDLIVTMLAEDGSLLRGVAHGARKPTSPFAARLELCAVVDVLMARGRSLDVVKESRLVEAHEGLRSGFDLPAAATPIAELAEKVAQAELENERLYQCAVAALGRMDGLEAPAARAIAAACLLKELSFAGLRPSLSACACCGEPADYASAPIVAFSPTEGGYVCDSCASQVKATRVDAREMAWARTLLHLPFAEVAASGIDETAVRGTLRMAQALIEAHVGARLKSLDFLLSTWA